MDNGEERKTFSIGDYVVFALLLLLSSAIGVYYAWKDRKAKDNSNFLSIRGQLGLFPVSVSLMASYVSAITILAIPGEMYTHGSQFFFCLIGIAIAVIVTDIIFLPVLYDLNLASINKYFTLRFGSSFLRLFCCFCTVMGTLFYLGAVLYGPSLAISSVTDLNLWASIVTIGVVCTFYTTIGGLKAVVWTDVIQMAIMTVGLFVVIIKVSMDVGGLTEVFKIADRGGRINFAKFQFHVFKPEPTAWDSVFSPAVTWSAAFVASQASIQRICGMPTLKKSRILIYLNIPGVWLLTTLACMCGIAIYAHYALCDPLATGSVRAPDELMPYYVMNAFSGLPGLPGVFVACVFSASLSTLSSGLNAIAAITWGDFLKPVLKWEGTKQIYATKFTAVIYGSMVIGVAFLSSNVGSILQASQMLSGPLTAAVFSIMLLGVLCPFANAKGAIVSVIVTVIFCLWTGVGGALVKRPQVSLPTTTEGCTYNFTLKDDVGSTEDDFEVPSGIALMKYFSPYFVGTAAFLLSTVLGIVGSLVTGGARGQVVESHLVHPALLRLSKRIQKNKRMPFWFPQYVTAPSLSKISEDKKESVWTIAASTQEMIHRDCSKTATQPVENRTQL